MFDTFNWLPEIRRFKILKMLYFPKGFPKAEPDRFHFFSFHFNVAWEGYLTLSIYIRNFTQKKKWKFYIPQRDSVKRTEGGQIVFYFIFFFFGLGNVYWTLNVLTTFWLFENLKICYPPKGLCKENRRRSIIFTYVLFVVRKRILYIQFTSGVLPCWEHENILSPGGTLQSRYRRSYNWKINSILLV